MNVEDNEAGLPSWGPDPEHLTILKQGVDTWNQWSAEHRLPFCFGANLKSADLRGANLKGADLRGAHLEEADLKGSHLEGADLRGAHLEGADLRSAYLEGANLVDADLDGADLKSAHLKGADLRGAHLADVDLRSSEGLLVNSTFILHARFSAQAKDPWSVLRRSYTGPRMIFTLILLITFALPYVIKVAFWSTVNQGQAFKQDTLELVSTQAEAAGIDEKTIRAIVQNDDAQVNLSRCLRASCEPVPVWQLALGVDKGPLFWIAALVLTFYNVLRGALTFIVAPMRNEEERSGYTPAWTGEMFWHGYRPLYYAHHVVVVLTIVATIAFAVNAQHWLSQTVWLPTPAG